MNPVDFLNTVVEPNIKAMLDTPGDLRLVHNAVSSVDALAAHIYHWSVANRRGYTNAKDDTHYRQLLSDADDDFSLLRDLAKMHKHVVLRRGKPRISDPSQQHVGSLDWEEIEWSDLGFGKSQNVLVIDDSGKARVVEAVVVYSLHHLQREMIALELLIPSNRRNQKPACT
ncbi:MAG: hypothetical protein BGO05_27885 [Rhizobiales bacterium 63-7]|nr:hypothetical protein [Hyphomicrobiales bacterium]OJU66042.1 MAG: hypothetical protein BGO05_27885 [Rhizobiales bacterium 63-7]